MDDLRKRKPRRIRGTPANRFVNLICLGTLGVGTVIGASLVFWDRSWTFHQKVIEQFHFSEEHKRKQFALQNSFSKIVQNKKLQEITEDKDQ